MKHETKILRAKSLESLLLAVEHFNSTSEVGRQDAILILLDRAFELLLKAIIVHKGGRIREPRAKETIGFDKCVRKCVSDAELRCLSDEQALTLQIINSLRDAAQHYMIDLSEQELYTYCQAGVTMFGDLLTMVFGESLRDHLPERVLPVSASPPKDLHEIIDAEFKDIHALVKPGSRKRLIASAKLRALRLLESSLQGERSQPSETELRKLVREIQAGKPWRRLFPGVASLNLTTDGTGLNVSIRLTKREGEPVHLVPEGTPGATVVAVRRVNELGYYNLGLQDVARNVELTAPKAGALISHLRLQEDHEYYKEVRVGKSRFKRYSRKAVQRLRDALEKVDMDAVWEKHRPRKKRAG